MMNRSPSASLIARSFEIGSRRAARNRARRAWLPLLGCPPLDRAAGRARSARRAVGPSRSTSTSAPLRPPSRTWRRADPDSDARCSSGVACSSTMWLRRAIATSSDLGRCLPRRFVPCVDPNGDPYCAQTAKVGDHRADERFVDIRPNRSADSPGGRRRPDRTGARTDERDDDGFHARAADRPGSRHGSRGPHRHRTQPLR